MVNVIDRIGRDENWDIVISHRIVDLVKLLLILRAGWNNNKSILCQQVTLRFIEFKRIYTLHLS